MNLRPRPSSARMLGSGPRPAFAVFGVAALAAFAAAARPALADGPTLAQHLEQKAPAIVSVKIVLKVQLSFGGQSHDQEQKIETRGVTVDPSGLVMLDDGGSQVKMIQRRFQGMQVSFAPTNIKILFGNEAKEYDAVLVARDTLLGVAFVQIVDLEGKTLAAVDLTAGAEPSIGQPLFAVSRLARGFDCAPQIERLYPSMKVTQPRPMWALTGELPGLGLPVFDMAGKPVGVIAYQEGAEGSDEDGSGPDGGAFLLPLSAVRRSMDAAKKRIPEALEKAKAAKEAPPKEPEAPPAMDGAPPAPPTEPDKPK